MDEAWAVYNARTNVLTVYVVYVESGKGEEKRGTGQEAKDTRQAKEMAEQHDKKYKVRGGGCGIFRVFWVFFWVFVSLWTNANRSEVGPLAAGRVDVFGSQGLQPLDAAKPSSVQAFSRPRRNSR